MRNDYFVRICLHGVAVKKVARLIEAHAEPHAEHGESHMRVDYLFGNVYDHWETHIRDDYLFDTADLYGGAHFFDGIVHWYGMSQIRLPFVE
mmetsp:Transcript_18208/g.21775  ORF Transcript_18208/g.21775 Transcript_18208/m.21775 type:complete len:92 (-) Transcript_18208:25-300(-)